MTENMFENYTLILIILFYLIGSIPFAVIISKIFSLPDPRSFGSNNPGATNVMRSGNKIGLPDRFSFILSKDSSYIYFKYIWRRNQCYACWPSNHNGPHTFNIFEI